MKALIAILAIVFGLGIPVGLMYVSYSNTEVTLRTQANAQEKKNKVIFDKVWKVIQSQAKVADKYKEGFENIFVKIMDARYEGKDNLLFNFVTESNPTFSTELYVKLANSIESQRTEFAMTQVALIDIAREHDLLLTKIPSKWFLMGRKKLDIKIVTSTNTEKAFETGKEDELGL